MRSARAARIPAMPAHARPIDDDVSRLDLQAKAVRECRRLAISLWLSMISRR